MTTLENDLNSRHTVKFVSSKRPEVQNGIRIPIMGSVGHLCILVFKTNNNQKPRLFLKSTVDADIYESVLGT